MKRSLWLLILPLSLLALLVWGTSLVLRWESSPTLPSAGPGSLPAAAGRFDEYEGEPFSNAAPAAASTRTPEPITEFFLATTSNERRLRLWEEAQAGENDYKLELALRILESGLPEWEESARQLVLLYLGEDPGDHPAGWRSKVSSRQRSQEIDKTRILQKLRDKRDSKQ